VLYALFKNVVQVHDYMLDLRSVGDSAAKTLIRVFHELDRNIIKTVKTLAVKNLIEKYPRQRFGGEWRGNALEGADFHGSEDGVLQRLFDWFEIAQTSNCPNPICNVYKGDKTIHPGKEQIFPEVLTPTTFAFILSKGYTKVKVIPACMWEVRLRERARKGFQQNSRLDQMAHYPL